MPEQRALLLGRWDRASVEILGRRLTLVTREAAGRAREPVDWILLRADLAGRSGQVGTAVVASTRLWASGARRSWPGAHLVVLDPDGVWEGGDSDVYLGGAEVTVEELLGVMSLTGRGFRVDARRGPAPAPAAGPEPEPLDWLTVRERELVDGLCAGLGNDQIAQRLGISRSTVEFHLTKIFKKLGVSSRTEAVVRVMQLSRPPSRAPSA